MRCSNCSSDNPDGSKFCGSCGKPLRILCSNCKTEIPGHFAFCNGCGRSTQPVNDVGAQSPSEATAPTTLSEGKIESVDIVADAQGERKTVTALFADMKDSTAFLYGLDPEEASALIDPMLGLMVEAVQEYDGHAAQSTGDGIFAIFGAPIAREDHAQRALHAALKIQEKLRTYWTQPKLKGIAPIHVRIGINTGEAVLRTVSTGDHTEYLPVGRMVNVAARMQSVAPPDGIVIGDDTRRLVEGYFELKSLGSPQIKGIPDPMNVFEVVSSGSLRGHFDLATRRGLTKFVGRENELRQMDQALQTAVNGRGQLMCVVADAGTGKSRLFHEFKANLPSQCKLLEAHSVSHGKRAAWLPVLELLRGYFTIDLIDSAAVKRKKITDVIIALETALINSVPYLFALLGVGETPDPLAEMDPPIKLQRTLDTIKRIVLRESLNQPVVFAFEDLHWIDGETQALLELLANSIASSRIMLLFNYRPEYQHQWSNKSYYKQMRLDALGTEGARAMVDSLLNEPTEIEHLKRLIIQRTEGNPFFIEETVKALLDEGVLVASREDIVRQPISQLILPSTVHGILASRIDRLPTAQKQLLQTLSVIGRDSSLLLLTRMLAQSEKELDQMLAGLCSGEFVYEQQGSAGTEYVFKHALTQEVAYKSLLIERRKALHERAADSLESLFAERIDDHLSEIAYHYSQSANAEKAAKYLSLAGQQAATRSAQNEAVAYFEAGMAVLEHVPQGPERLQLELSMQIGFGFSLRATKGFMAPEVERPLLRARELCCEVSDGSQLFDALVGLHTFYMFRRQRGLETSKQLAEELLRLGERLELPNKLATAHLALGETNQYLGDFEVARHHLTRAITLGAGRQGIVHNAVGYLASDLWSLGYMAQARAQMEESLVAFPSFKRPLLKANVLSYACTFFVQLRLWRKTLESAAAGLALATDCGFAFHSYLFMVFKGRSLVEQGEISEGIAEMRRGLAGLDSLGAARPWLICYLGEGLRRSGQNESALEVLARAESETEETGERWALSDLHRLRSELLADAADFEGAERSARRAFEIACAQAAKAFELRAATTLARLLFRKGRAEQARTILLPVYNWFTEGFNYEDLKEARCTLDEMGTKSIPMWEPSI
jgi:class 3 adenylate cyclase/tetratricopeptide (TPR) repeat protein